MNLAKLSLNHLIAFILGSIIFGLFIYSGQLGLQAVSKSLSVDEKLVVSSATVLNKDGIDEVLEKIGEDKLTTNNKQQVTSDEKEKENNTEKTEEQTIQNDKNDYPESIEIINSSGVNGAASKLSEIFDEEKTKISLKNGEEILDETAVFYQNGYSSFKTQIDEKLVKMGFEEAVYEENEDKEDVDLKIILGKSS